VIVATWCAPTFPRFSESDSTLAGLHPSLFAMSKRAAKSSPKEHRWHISRIGSTSALKLGTVYAPDEKTALRKAAEEFRVLQDRLLARRDHR
jgi:hypothetical protein